MSIDSRSHQRVVSRRTRLFVFGIFILLTIIIPALNRWDGSSPPMIHEIPDEIYDEFTPPIPYWSTIAGESNFTRVNYPFILNNYPDFSWNDPGSGAGTGFEAYPEIFNALEGLNESNIRVVYLNAHYEWVIVPYQIDHKGWANVWQIADLNRWAGIDMPTQGRIGNDQTPGLGWINGELVTSEGDSYASYNDLQIDWYRIPTHTFVSPYQPDGSYTDERVNIDPEYRDDLVWIYHNDPLKPHDSWPTTPYAGDASEPWILTAGGAPRAGPFTNVIYMGDTWFKTPDKYNPDPAIAAAFNYEQLNGRFDKDDELVFYTYPGRKADNWLWWNYSSFPYRFELQIVDPIDGGHCWMYIYYNNLSIYDPFDGGINLGSPLITTPLKDYVSWDPDSMTITSDIYQSSLNENNPSLLDSAKLFGETDGQQLLTSFNKMYGYGRVSDDVMEILSEPFAGREGLWYDYSSWSRAYSELISTLDNPSVWYPSVADDTSYMETYNSEQTAARGRSTSPQQYVGPMGVTRGAGTGKSIISWEKYGDKRAIIDGPCRVILYLQQYLVTGLHAVGCACSVGIDDYVDFYATLLDGPQIYYQRMQISPPMLFTVPNVAALEFEMYYIYLMSGNIFVDIRNDINLTGGIEWSGGSDGTDDGNPIFGWANDYGWSKIGGLNPMVTSYSPILGSIFDGNGGIGDYYDSGGDPLQDNYNSYAVPSAGNTLPDWIMLTSESHGGVWMYVPKRELYEITDNMGSAAPNAEIKMYYRDDSRVAEFGVCIDAEATPWIKGGASTSPYSFMMVYGDYQDEDVIKHGHRNYLNYYFPLTAITSFTIQTLPPQFIYNSVLSDQLGYKMGNTLTIDVTGSTDNATIFVDFSQIESTDPNIIMTNNNDGTYNLTYIIDNIDNSSSERNITLTASVPTWPDSIYNLTLTIDIKPPNPTAELMPLSPLLTESSVLLDWSAKSGYDEESASMVNPSGLGHYRLRRGLSSGIYDTILADNISITINQFEDFFIEDGEHYYYLLDTYDEVGNYNTSDEVDTIINLPCTPAQPNELPVTINPMNGITIDWTANPGYGVGVSIPGYEVYRSTALSGPYIPIVTGLPASTTSYTDNGPFTEVCTYYYKVRTRTNRTYWPFSSQIHTKIDTVKPAPAALATPFPTYYAKKAEIIVSWAVETIPQYESGGFPGHDMNGIDHWAIYKKTGAGSWILLKTVPFSPNKEDQRIIDTDVVNGGTYSYSMTTYDAAGNFAICEYNKMTTLQVVGSGIAEVYSVEAGTSEVKQGDNSIPVTVFVRNPGINNVTLNEVKLLFVKDSINLTDDYLGIIWKPNINLAAFSTLTHTFYVDVELSATLGTVEIKAQTIYNSNRSSVGAMYPDFWLVKSDADLITTSVTSSCGIIHPGKTDIPVFVQVNNPGRMNIIIESIQLKFRRGETDLSNKFLVERITPLPTIGFKGDFVIGLNITVGVSITHGSVTVDAIVAGSASGISLIDADGAESILPWAIETWPIPVIVNIEANKEVYWSPDNITLMVTCNKAGYNPVRANFISVDTDANWENGIDNGDGTYTITHALVNPVGEGTYNIIVEATNASGTVIDIIGIRLGQAPIFSGWVQTPPNEHIIPYQAVDININITDNNGADNVQAIFKYRVDGAMWITQPMTYAGSTQWNVTIPGQTNGACVEYVINATDTIGNWALFSRNYAIFNAILSPKNQSYNSQTISIVVYNKSRIDRIWYRVNSGLGWSSNYTLIFNGTYFIDDSTLVWADGFYHIQIFINDSLGDKYLLNEWLTVDIQPPSGFQWENLTSNHIQNEQTIWLKGTAYDPSPSSMISNIFISDSNTSALWSNNVGSQTEWAFYNLSSIPENIPGEFYQINVNISDIAGNSFILICNISVDTTSPIGSQYPNTSNPQNAMGGNVWINGSAVDYGKGLKKIKIVSDNVTGGITWSSNLGSNLSWSFTNTSSIQDTPPNSVFEIIIEILDLANNSYYLKCSIIVDSTPPEGTQNLGTISPQKGGSNSLIWVNGSALDTISGVKSVIIIGDNITGGANWSLNTESPLNWAFKNTSPIVDTPLGYIYEVLVNITDNAANSIIIPCYIFVDTTSPNGLQDVFTSPVYIQHLDRNGRIWVNGTATDFGSGLQEVFIQNTNITGGSSWINVGTLQQWAFYNNTPVPELNNGECYSIELIITDLVNNSFLLNCYISFDSSGPTLSQSSSTIDWQSGSMIWLNGTAQDKLTNISSITIITSNFTLLVNWTTNLGTNQSWSFRNISALPEGQWGIILQAIDTLGNSRNYLAIISIDLTPPTSPLIYYEVIYAPSFVFEDTLVYLFGSSDSGGSGISYYEYRIDLGTWMNGDRISLAGLSDGPHTFHYRAVDRSENIGNNQNITIFLLNNCTDYDNDGLTNAMEIYVYGTSAISSDTDNDGLNDNEEISIYGTEPTNSDTDSDGITDGVEILLGTDPLDYFNPSIHNVLLMIGISCGFIVSGVIIVIYRKKKNFNQDPQQSSSYEFQISSKNVFDILCSTIPSIPSLSRLINEENEGQLPLRLQNRPPDDIFLIFQQLLNWVPETELKLNLSEILIDIEYSPENQKIKHFLPYLKQLNKLTNTGINRELLNYVVVLTSLIKNIE